MAREDSPYWNRFMKSVFHGDFGDAMCKLDPVTLPPYTDIPDLEIDTGHYIRFGQNRWRRPKY
jgi:hypothetical protein